MTRTISQLARHWMRQSDNGKGIRLEAADMDLLNANGVGALIQSLASEEQRLMSRARVEARAAPSDPAPRSAPSAPTPMFTPEVVAGAAHRARRATKKPGQEA